MATDAWANVDQGNPPNVALIGPATLAEHLRTAKDGSFVGRFNLYVINGAREAIRYHVSGPKSFYLSVISDRAYTKKSPAPAVVPIKPSRMLRASSVSRVAVLLTVYDADTTSLQVVMTVAQSVGAPPSSVTITLTRTPRSSNLIWIIFGSLIAGAIVIATFAWAERNKPKAKDIYADSTFSFGQSWATNLGAIFTAVAAIFTTTGVLSDLVPGIDTGFFLALNIGYGIVLLLPALVYSACQTLDDDNHLYGTRRGYRLAAMITGIAIGGQLSTVGAIIALSDLADTEQRLLLAFLAIVYAVVVIYMEANRRQLWDLKKPVPPKTSIVTASHQAGAADQPDHTHDVVLAMAPPPRMAALP